jgi:peptide-methionine (S)-S-oxide reductase
MNTRTHISAIVLAASIVFAFAAAGADRDPKGRNMPDNKNLAYATLGGGCFWCLEAVYELMPGVVDVVSGYAGGNKANPTYEEVCTGLTNHAEVVRIAYDPAKVTFSELLDMFWKIHDPTSLYRQGADVGTQYRSIILYENESQKKEAEASIARIAKEYAKPIVTAVKPLDKFWVAEDYHQDYYRNNPDAGYCQVVIAPKVKKAGF